MSLTNWTTLYWGILSQNLHQLRLLEENLYRTSTTKHCKTGYVRSTSVHLSVGLRRKRQTVVDVFSLGIGRGKYLSGCSFVWFSALVYCQRKSYLLSTLRIVCHRVKVLSSRLCSTVASLSASCCRFILTTREYCIDNTGCNVEHWTINKFKRKWEHVILIILGNLVSFYFI